MEWIEAKAGLWLYQDDNGGTVGALMLLENAWECIYLGDVVVIRPELPLAKRAVEQAHLYRERAKGAGR